MSAAAIKELTTFIDELIYSLVISEKYLSRNSSLVDCEFRTLKFLEANNNTNMRDVAKFLGVTLPRTTAIVDGLVDKDLVTRKHSEKDRRTVIVQLTGGGKDMLEYSSNYYKNISLKLSSDLTKDEKIILMKLIKKCNGCLKQELNIAEKVTV